MTHITTSPSRKLRLFFAATLAALAVAPAAATQVASAAGPDQAAPPTSDARGDFCKPWHPPCA